MKDTKMVTMMGNRIFSVLDDGTKLLHLDLALFLGGQQPS